MLQAKHYSVGYEHRKGIKDTKVAKHGRCGSFSQWTSTENKGTQDKGDNKCLLLVLSLHGS